MRVLPPREDPSLSDTRIPEEVEAKFLVSSEAILRNVASITHLGIFNLKKRRGARLRTTYLDTDQLSLAHHRVALRVRCARRAWELTAKWSGKSQGAIHSRPEMTIPLSGEPKFPLMLPEGEIQQQVFALVAGRALHPIMMSDVFRSIVDVEKEESDGPRVIAEIALDRVRICDPGGAGLERRYFEVEIEQRDGSLAELRSIVRLLEKEFPLKTSKDSKFSAGLKLLYGGAKLGKAGKGLKLKDSVAIALCKTVSKQLATIREHDPGVRDDANTDVEDLHSMRIAVRRLRSGLKMFAGALSQVVLSSLERELEWLAEALGPVRDCDVQLEIFRRSAEALSRSQRATVDDILAELTQQRREARLRLVEALYSKRYLRLLMRLEKLSATKATREDDSVPEVFDVAGPHLRRSFQSFRKSIAREPESQSQDHLHSLRIQVKRLRYSIEMLGLDGSPSGRKMKRVLKRAQDILGDYNDCAIAIDHVQDYVERKQEQLKAPQIMALNALISRQVVQSEMSRYEFSRLSDQLSDKKSIRELLSVVKRRSSRKAKS